MIVIVSALHKVSSLRSHLKTFFVSHAGVFILWLRVEVDDLTGAAG